MYGCVQCELEWSLNRCTRYRRVASIRMFTSVLRVNSVASWSSTQNVTRASRNEQKRECGRGRSLARGVEVPVRQCQRHQRLTIKDPVRNRTQRARYFRAQRRSYSSVLFCEKRTRGDIAKDCGDKCLYDHLFYEAAPFTKLYIFGSVLTHANRLGRTPV